MSFPFTFIQPPHFKEVFYEFERFNLKASNLLQVLLCAYKRATQIVEHVAQHLTWFTNLFPESNYVLRELTYYKTTVLMVLWSHPCIDY